MRHRVVSPKCVVCGTADLRVLHINHVDIKSGVVGVADFTRILSGLPTEDKLDVRCANHNLIYEFERGRRAPYPEVPDMASPS